VEKRTWKKRVENAHLRKTRGKMLAGNAGRVVQRPRIPQCVLRGLLQSEGRAN